MIINMSMTTPIIMNLIMLMIMPMIMLMTMPRIMPCMHIITYFIRHIIRRPTMQIIDPMLAHFILVKLCS